MIPLGIFFFFLSLLLFGGVSPEISVILRGVTPKSSTLARLANLPGGRPMCQTNATFWQLDWQTGRHVEIFRYVTKSELLTPYKVNKMFFDDIKIELAGCI